MNIEITRDTIRASNLRDEAELVAELIAATGLSAGDRAAISARAAELVRDVRGAGSVGVMEAFLAEYGLSTEEGVALMCLAEAMLRVPDAATVDELIRDKITPHDWAAHLGDSGSILVNASTWALMLTGRILDEETTGVVGTLHGLVKRLGEPVIRKAVGQAMAEMGAQFVLGETIAEAMERGTPQVEAGYTYSYDMLGEAARTEADAARYHAAYLDAIRAIALRATSDDIRENPGISVKLSALHPRYERAQAETMLPQMTERLLVLVEAAAEARIGLNIDAEEADRLDLSLDVIAAVMAAPALDNWDGFGIVVQAFGRRALPVIDHLHALAETHNRRIMVRLVKGAYWDTEVKRAQVLGLADYPVFTRKAHTDVSYLAGARRLLDRRDRIYPQFATHNAHSVAAILAMAGAGRDGFEFQRLHGMGETLHDLVHRAEDARCRIYAPVGAHEDLLAYLVRRLLENGANSSFVNQIVDLDVPEEEIAADPIAAAETLGTTPPPALPRPAEIFAPRLNSAGWDLTDPVDLARIEEGRAPFAAPYRWQVGPVSPLDLGGTTRDVINPARPGEVVGNVTEPAPDAAPRAMEAALKSAPDWAAQSPSDRAKVLRRAAEIIEENACEIFALLAREAGKTLGDGVAEIREAVDFLRYYADEAERLGYTGTARGVILCISPWNFPLAIFTGQIAAALAAGNTVIAKPAEQTPLIAARAVTWLIAAGLPDGVLQLLPGDGATIGAALTREPALGGVCFTGSTEVAKIIERQLAESAPEAMLIAETGGLNAMVADSTALPEQAVRDILRAAFQSAGQRCSALRMLYVQEDVAPGLTEMLTGAMASLVVGDPWDLATDVGPVIDAEAWGEIGAYAAGAENVLERMAVPEAGHFIAPMVLNVGGIDDIPREIFGPVLHLATFKAAELEAVIASVNGRGYGLTFGLHSRIDQRVQDVIDRIGTGNVYVNRDQIGAVVGSQPFGGHGLSGTGPKAGGPLYLPRFRKSEPAPEAPLPRGGVTLADLEAGFATLAPAPRPSLADLRAALRGRGAAAMAAAARLDMGPVDLPGPTGEANQYELVPKGRVLCLGPDGETLLAQMVQGLALGNRVMAVAPGARAALKPLLGRGFALMVVDGALSDTSLLANAPVDLVAFRGTGLRPVLAARPGPILPLVTEAIAPAAYGNERAICIDTTAAGGNAALLAEAENGAIT
ncbi:MAG: bifunctional proline dehydrogenase/L-glutamate gamma-semialdehyde dehydrogenase PutA [Silicimonas sp.]|nr:bifunctional proline dehydrogenase/L-glutamate gamma-semialdehyde dehydrogenase PutA [Silicimonas sp.]